MADVNLNIKQTLNVTCMKNDTFSLDMDWTDAAAVDRIWLRVVVTTLRRCRARWKA